MDKQSRKPRRRRVASPFAKNLRALMSERGFTITAAARLAGVSAPVVHAWLQGGSPHDLCAVAKLAKALDADFQWLLTDEHAQARSGPANLAEAFDIRAEPDFSGIWMIEAKRIRIKKGGLSA